MRLYGPLSSGAASGNPGRASSTGTSSVRLSGAIIGCYLRYNLAGGSASTSQSRSQSNSPSASVSPSPSNSPSRSISPSASFSPSASPSPSSPESMIDVYVKTLGTGSGAIPAYNILVLGNQAVDGWYYPRVLDCTTPGTLLEQGANKTAVYTEIPIFDYVTVTIENAVEGDSVDMWLALEETTVL